MRCVRWRRPWIPEILCNKVYHERRYILTCLFLFVLGSVLYFHVHDFGLTYLDDAAIIAESANKFAADGSSLFLVFTRNIIAGLQPYAYYRPLYAASFMLNSAFCGRDLAGYYFTNIALHIAASCLIFTLLLRLGYRHASAFMLAVLHTVHPMLTQAVAWLPGRSDTLLTIFAISSFLAFIKFSEKPGLSNYSLHILFLFLALLSKESALGIIVLCFLYSRLILRRGLFFSGESWLLAGWLAAVWWFFLRQGAMVNPMHMPVPDMLRFITANSIVVIQYIGRIFFPFNLSVWPTIQDSRSAYGAAAILIIAVLLAFSKNARRDYVVFGASWFILFIIPTLIRQYGRAPENLPSSLITGFTCRLPGLP